MKSGRLILLLIFINLFIAGCNNDNDYSLDNYWITIGNIEGDNDGFIVVTDGGDRLFPSANAVPGYPLENGDRLWVNYTILGDGEAGSDIDYYVKINLFEDILTKGIFILTPENADSIGHDPVWVRNPDENIWIANNYLNIFFKYEGAPWIVHFINVVSDTDNPATPEGTPILELRHNKNGDQSKGTLLTGFISIDLKSLQEEGKDSVNFILRAIDENGDYTLDKEYTYVYDNIPDSAATEAVNIRAIPENLKIE